MLKDLLRDLQKRNEGLVAIDDAIDKLQDWRKLNQAVERPNIDTFLDFYKEER